MKIAEFDTLRRLLDALPMALARRKHDADLAGEDFDEYGEWAQELRIALDELVGMANHRHQWNEDSYCSVCGADGSV